MKYNLDEITIRIIDVTAEARRLYGDKAEYVAGRPLPPNDFRFEIHAENDHGDKTTISCPQGALLSAEHILAMLNR